MNDLQIQYDNPQSVFFPGQTVTGKVVIQTSESIKARFLKICIHGNAETHWSEHERRSRIDSKGKNESYNETIHYSAKVHYLKGESMAWSSNDGSDKLPSGLLVFPFAFGLPVNCPPSFEGCHGCIRYAVHVELDRPWKFNKKTKKCFSVVPVFDLNTIPQAINPMVNSAYKNTGLLFKKGVVNMTVNIPKRGFVAGEILQITVVIDNGSKKPVIAVRAKINQMATFHAKRGHSDHVYDPCAVGQHHRNNEIKHDSNLVAESRQNINVHPLSKSQTVLSMKIPPIVPSFQTCPIISVDYCLSVKIDTASVFGNTLKCEFPLIIGTVPIRQYSIPAGSVPAVYPGVVGSSSVGPSAPPAEMPSSFSPSAPPYPVSSDTNTPPPYPFTQTASAPMPPSYEESMYGTSATTKNTDDTEAFAPRYPVYNNLQEPCPPLPMKK